MWTDKNIRKISTLNVKIGKWCKMDHFEKVRTCRERSAVQWPMSSQARLHAGRWYDSDTGQSHAGMRAWPVPVDVGQSQTLLCSWVQFSCPTSRSAFGRVNASSWIKCGWCSVILNRVGLWHRLYMLCLGILNIKGICKVDNQNFRAQIFTALYNIQQL